MVALGGPAPPPRTHQVAEVAGVAHRVLHALVCRMAMWGCRGLSGRWALVPWWMDGPHRCLSRPSAAAAARWRHSRGPPARPASHTRHAAAQHELGYAQRAQQVVQISRLCRGGCSGGGHRLGSVGGGMEGRRRQRIRRARHHCSRPTPKHQPGRQRMTSCRAQSRRAPVQCTAASAGSEGARR